MTCPVITCKHPIARHGEHGCEVGSCRCFYVRSAFKIDPIAQEDRLAGTADADRDRDPAEVIESVRRAFEPAEVIEVVRRAFDAKDRDIDRLHRVCDEWRRSADQLTETSGRELRALRDALARAIDLAEGLAESLAEGGQATRAQIAELRKALAS